MLVYNSHIFFFILRHLYLMYLICLNDKNFWLAFFGCIKHSVETAFNLIWALFESIRFAAL